MKSIDMLFSLVCWATEELRQDPAKDDWRDEASEPNDLECCAHVALLISG
jgi:hypothetical protein